MLLFTIALKKNFQLVELYNCSNVLVKFLLICQIWMLVRRTPDPKGSRDPNGIVLVSLLLILNIFHTLF